MDAEWKRKWVEALRSGKYLQTQGSLRETYADGTARFCCLGVLCDITGVGGWGVSNTYHTATDKSSARLPKEVVKVVGLNSSDPFVSAPDVGLNSSDPFVSAPDGRDRTLSAWNDDGSDFKSIAELIDANL